MQPRYTRQQETKHKPSAVAASSSSSTTSSSSQVDRLNDIKRSLATILCELSLRFLKYCSYRRRANVLTFCFCTSCAHKASVSGRRKQSRTVCKLNSGVNSTQADVQGTLVRLQTRLVLARFKLHLKLGVT